MKISSFCSSLKSCSIFGPYISFIILPSFSSLYRLFILKVSLSSLAIFFFSLYPLDGFPTTAVLKLLHISESSESLVKTQVAQPDLQNFIQEIWVSAQVFTFLTNAQVVLTLLIQGPHFENHCSTTLEHLDLFQQTRICPLVEALVIHYM